LWTGARWAKVRLVRAGRYLVWSDIPTIDDAVRRTSGEVSCSRARNNSNGNTVDIRAGW